MSQCPLSPAHQGTLKHLCHKKEGQLEMRELGELSKWDAHSIQDGDPHSDEPSASKAGDPESYLPQTLQGSKSYATVAMRLSGELSRVPVARPATPSSEI